MCKGVLPLSGAKTAKQVSEAAGAFGWRLTDAEMRELDAVSGRLASAPGAPFENW